MYDRKLVLRWLFNELIKLSHRVDMMEEAIVGGGYPLSGLVDSIINPFGRILVDNIVDSTDSNSHEFRLNGAGFKLYWRLDQRHNLLKISVGGDQAVNYPHFVAAMRQIIEQTKLR